MSEGLYKRGKIYWLRRDPVTGCRRSTKCRSLKAAQAYRAERELLGADPSYAASHSATVAKWAKELIRVKTATKSAGTADMYRTKIGHVVRVLKPETKMVNVTPGAVDRYVAERASEFAENVTIGKELIALTQMCKLAKRAGEYAGDVGSLRPVGFDASGTPRTTTLTWEQVTALLGALKPYQAAAVQLAVATGARRSEVQRIRAEDIDLVNWTVRIAGTKTDGSDRVIPIALPRQRALLVLAHGSGLLPVTWTNMSADLPEACVKLGLPRATPNDLRRSFATWSIEAGVQRADVAKLLGHTSTAMVFRVYGRESAAALGQKIVRDLGDDDGTPDAQYPLCFAGENRESSMFYGVSDGDRTRDNRSHNPKPWSELRPCWHVFRWFEGSGVPLGDTKERDVGTSASQFRAASWAWFRRAA